MKFERKNLLAHKSFFQRLLEKKPLSYHLENADWEELKILLHFLFWITTGKIPISKQLAKKLLDHKQYKILKKHFSTQAVFDRLSKWNRSRHIALLQSLKSIIRLVLPILKHTPTPK